MEQHKFPSGPSGKKPNKKEKQRAKEQEKIQLEKNKRREFIKKGLLLGAGAVGVAIGAHNIFLGKKEENNKKDKESKENIPIQRPDYETIIKNFQELAPKISLADLGIHKETNPNLYFSEGISGLMRYPEIKDLLEVYFEKNKIQDISTSTIENKAYLDRLCTEGISADEVVRKMHIIRTIQICFLEQNYFFNNNLLVSEKAFGKLSPEGTKSLTTEQSKNLGEIFADTNIEPKLDYQSYTIDDNKFNIKGLNIENKVVLNESLIRQSFETESKYLADFKWAPTYPDLDYSTYKKITEMNELASVFFNEHYNEFAIPLDPYGKVLNLHIKEFIGDVASFKTHPKFLFNRLSDYWIRVVWEGQRASDGTPITENPGYALTNNIFSTAFVKLLKRDNKINDVVDFENKLRANFKKQNMTTPISTEKTEVDFNTKRLESMASLFKMLSNTDLQELQNNMVYTAKEILKKIEKYKK
jgi:hypothetical protein